MHGKKSVIGADMSVRVALPTAAELLRAAESSGKPVDLHAIATLPVGREKAGGAANAAEPSDEAVQSLERIHDTIGRLALLEYQVSQATDAEQRRDIFREMFDSAQPLPGELGRLLVDANWEATGGDESQDDDDIAGQRYEPTGLPADTELEDKVTRAVAIRFLGDSAPFASGQWHPELFGADSAKFYAESMARLGITVRLYDVEANLDRGTMKVTPQPGFKGMVEKPEYVPDPDVILHPESEAEGPDDGSDDPIEIGDVSFERSPGRWRVYLIDTESYLADGYCVVEFGYEHVRQSHVMAWVESWLKKPIGCSAVAVGPGEGEVTVRCAELFEGSWSVYQANVSPEPDAVLVAFCDQREAKRLAKRVTRKDGCPVIIAPYKAEDER